MKLANSTKQHMINAQINIINPKKQKEIPKLYKYSIQEKKFQEIVSYKIIHTQKRYTKQSFEFNEAIISSESILFVLPKPPKPSPK